MHIRKNIRRPNQTALSIISGTRGNFERSKIYKNINLCKNLQYIWRIKDSNNKIVPTWDTRVPRTNGSKMEYFSSFLLSIYVRDVSFCWRSIEPCISNTPLNLVFIYKRFQLSSGGKPFRIGYRTTYHWNLPPTGNWQLLHSER